MRAPSRLAFVAWFVVSVGGCAAVTGLDGISEQDCAPNCGTDAQMGPDVTTDGHGNDSPTNDVVSDHPSGNDAPGEGSSAESSTEGSTGESGVKDGGSDAPVDSPPDVVFSDAPFDSGCGNLNTTTNCSACGDHCAAVSSSVTGVSCPGSTNGAGATCQYTCATGYLDCNGALNPPDLDGCECQLVNSPNATQANCGSGSTGTPGCCPVQHTDGLAVTPTFFDCIARPVGTTGYTVDLATDACVQFTGNQADCGAGECTNPNDAGTGDFVVCGQTSAASECACWEYMGPNNGKVTTATGAILGQCLCPGSTGAGISTFSYN
ncbi:MAG: hypothetical protein ACRELB_08215 [Polyangiaceae bacterium]